MTALIVAGNWKQHGDLASNLARMQSLVDLSGKTPLNNTQMAVLVPYPYLSQVAQVCQNSAVTWGAQDISCHTGGAYTGEVSAAMVTDFSAQWVIVGHSERRALFAEHNDLVGKKANIALAHQLRPIICVGETLEQRDAGQTLTIVLGQLDAALAAIEADDYRRIVIAYEPVWAIGTGKTASAEQAEAVHAAIRQRLSEHSNHGSTIAILYGGSVKPENAAQLFAQPNINGGLIGGASLNADDFWQICLAAEHATT